MVKLSRGDRVLGKDGRGFMVEMMVEETGYTAAGELMVTCVWPIFENGDQPLYRRALPREELVPVGQSLPKDEDPLPSKRPPEPGDMRAMHIPRMSPEEARAFFDLNNRPTTSTMVVLPAPAISPEALDRMAGGWTPDQVRALIADYRKLAGYT